MNNDSSEWTEMQVTNEKCGHFMNPVQSFSPDDHWIAYDTRNHDPDIGRTGSIGRFNLNTGQKEIIYEVPNQSIFGPGVGAVAYSPVSDQVVFIHGLRNADKNHPYGISRRTGMGMAIDDMKKAVHLDARNVYDPFTFGALRGGTHAHSWSGDGHWISFTYNDDVMAELSLKDNSVEDLRMVGVMAPWGEINVPGDDRAENNNGRMFSMIISRVTANPEPGSDEISKAYEDGWIGEDGYVDSLGQNHPKAVAFLGDVRDGAVQPVTEVFVTDLPETRPDILNEAQLKGDSITRPMPLSMVHQRRVTFTTNRKYPGVQGPRQWMQSSPNGTELYFMMKDDNGLVQIYSVPTKGGDIKAITTNNFSIETSFDVDPSGRWVAFGASQKIYRTSLESGDTECIAPMVIDKYSNLRAIQWSHSGQELAYNRKVIDNDSSYYQIFTLSKNGK